MSLDLIDVARRLRELIVALDRRVPRIGRAGEAAIAEDAAALREKAVARLAEIAGQTASPPNAPAVEPATLADGRSPRTM